MHTPMRTLLRALCRRALLLLSLAPPTQKGTLASSKDAHRMCIHILPACARRTYSGAVLCVYLVFYLCVYLVFTVHCVYKDYILLYGKDMYVR